MSVSIYSTRVKEMMSRDVVSLHVDASVHEALNLMVDNRVSALPIVDSRGRCVGILTTTDLVDLTRDLDEDVHRMDFVDPTTRRWLVEKMVQTVGTEPVSSFMSEDVATVGRETPLAVAARDMLRNHVHHLPVVDSSERVIGIVSTMDILSVLADGADDIASAAN